MRAGEVYYQGKLAGIIRETEAGFSYSYTPQWLADPNAQPISLTLPLRPAPYTARTLFPFFDGLIPEGFLLELSLKNWKLDRKDRFGLLLLVCRDPIGAVSVQPEVL